jgi:hypothetical protein
MLVSDTMDVPNGTSVQEMINELHERGCVNTGTAFFYDFVEVEFEREETPAEARKREAVEKRAKATQAARRQKKEDEEYQTYLKLAQKYGA